jgi:PAS domain S-box-containing protein
MISGGTAHAKGAFTPVDLRRAINRVDDGFFDLDREWHIRFVNRAAAQMLGRRVEDLVGNNIWDEFPTAIGTPFDLRYRAAFDTQQADEFEEYFELLDMWFSIRVYPTPEGISLVFRDITHVRNLTARHHGLLVRLLEAEDAERARIAADVHEDSVQALGAVTLQLQLLRHHLSAPSPEVDAIQKALSELVMSATDRLRALLFSLEPTSTNTPFAESLRNFAAQIFDQTPIHWSVDDLDQGDELPDLERGQALRIAREALSNVRAHAEATEVIITLRGHEKGLEIVIGDNGAALDPASFVSAPGHRGLATMRDRAAILGGTCRVEAVSPHGCTVRVFVPRLERMSS